MVLLDTCALVWWALDPAKLSRKAASICERMEKDGGFVSSIALWELGIKIKRRKLDIGMSVRTFCEKLRQTGVLEILPVDEKIWMANLELNWDHGDPVDRTIVATAQLMDLPILTKDSLISRFYGKTIW